MTATLTMMAISTSGCATPATKANAYKGRVIEYKSSAAGFDTRTFFYEGENEVIAFDAQFTPELARASIAELRKLTTKPITWLVITHPNPDKFNGAEVFKSEGARVLASRRTASALAGVHAYKKYFFVELAKMFKPGAYPELATVDQTFEGEMSLVLRGGETIQLRELLRPGVSSTQTVAYVESIGALFSGDLVHHKAHAWLEGGIENGKATPHLEGWIADLEELARIFPSQTTVHGGRGVSGPLGTVVPAQIQYLTRAQALIEATLAELGEKSKDFLGPKSSERYKDLATKFEKAFPDYALPYMIEYGSYGLVQQLLERQTTTSKN